VLPVTTGANMRVANLVAPAGTEIFAVADGVVIETSRGILPQPCEGSGHTASRICRAILRIRDAAPGIKLKSEVKAGQVVAFVGQMFHAAMLHFEVYSGTMAGPLTVRSNKPFQRRADIIDPTALLGRLAGQVLESHAGFAPQRKCG